MLLSSQVWGHGPLCPAACWPAALTLLMIDWVLTMVAAHHLQPAQPPRWCRLQLAAAAWRACKPVKPAIPQQFTLPVVPLRSRVPPSPALQTPPRRKPHLQGRFSGRLATKDDEKRLNTECRLLGPLLGGVGKRGDGSRLTLAKIVRGIAAGEVRKFCEERERAIKVRGGWGLGGWLEAWRAINSTQGQVARPDLMLLLCYRCVWRPLLCVCVLRTPAAPEAPCVSAGGCWSAG